MSALTHLADTDAAWAEAMLFEWSNDLYGRHCSTEPFQRDGAASESRDFLTGFDPEQAAANAGFRVGPACDPLGAKRADPPAP